MWWALSRPFCFEKYPSLTASLKNREDFLTHQHLEPSMDFQNFTNPLYNYVSSSESCPLCVFYLFLVYRVVKVNEKLHVVSCAHAE